MYIHWMKLRKQQNWIFSFFLVLSNILSCEASSATIIRYIVQGYTIDFFSFTDDGICRSQGADEWCKGKNAYRVPSTGIGNFRPTHSCTCQCKNNKKTFVFEKKECVNISYLENRDDFGKGHYFFTATPINLLNGPSSFATNKYCANCIVHKVLYFMRSNWHEITQKWNISIQGVLSTEPGTNPKDANGKVLKIQLRDCACNSWGSKNPLIFLKSIGNYTVNIGPTTFPSSTLTPTPALITSQNLMTSPLEQGNTYTRYTSTRTEITEQVSTATVILVSPAWDSVSSEIFPKSTSAVMQYSTTSKPGNDNALGAEDPSSVGAIVGSIVACIVLMAVIVFCFVWKRRKVNLRRSSSGTPKVPSDSTGNPMCEQNQGEVIALPCRQGENGLGADEGIEEYDYAAVDGDGSKDHSVQSKPIYQSLIKDNVQDSVYTSLNKETLPEYSYNHLQHPTYNPHSKDVPNSEPLYNKLQKPEVDYVNAPVDYQNHAASGQDNIAFSSNIDPIIPLSPNSPDYDVPGGPEGTLSDPKYQSLIKDNVQDSAYTTLNKEMTPDSKDVPSQPLYINKLQKPEVDYVNAPVDDQNHAAPGQDNIAFPPSPDYKGPEGTLSDPTYQSLGIRTQDDVYQPLDRTSPTCLPDT